MAKFRLREGGAPGEVPTEFWLKECNGEIILKCSEADPRCVDWDVLKISREGNLILANSLPRDIGLNTESTEGRDNTIRIGKATF